MELDMNEINAGNKYTIIMPKSKIQEAQYCVKCLVCDEDISINYPYDDLYKICDKCKRAILKMREYMKED